MFLTHKALKKIKLISGAYFIISALLFMFAVLYAVIGMNYTFLIILATISFAGGLIGRKAGRYSEGKGKLVGRGYRLVHHELKPAEFIRLYEEKRDDPDNVIAEPDFEVLSILAAAYDALGDKEHSIETVNELIKTAPDKRKAEAKLIKCGSLYDMGNIEEADILLSEVKNEGTSLAVKGLSQIITDSDRALAYGDYLIAEEYFKKALVSKFPHNTPLSMLYNHYHLAEIYVKTNRPDEAKAHLEYCIRNGGETGIPADAQRMSTEL